eukprot:5252149-Pyramimonas_sp.AAC.1
MSCTLVMGTRQTLANVEHERARRYGDNRILKRNRPQSVKLLQLKKRVRAALRRKPHVENGPPSIREARKPPALNTWSS